MNQRITELAEQAGIKEYPAKLSVYKEDDGTTSSKWEYPLEKFAEIIVRECVAICQDVDGEEDAMAKCGRQDCAVEIREHFGVEE